MKITVDISTTEVAELADIFFADDVYLETDEPVTDVVEKNKLAILTALANALTASVNSLNRDNPDAA